MNWYFRVFKKYGDFHGRAQRAEYWYFVLFNIIIDIILRIIDIAIGTYDAQAGYGMLGAIYALIILVPSLAVATRRLHDVDKSGWWLLLMLIPIIGAIILIIWFATNSKEDNKYGHHS